MLQLETLKHQLELEIRKREQYISQGLRINDSFENASKLKSLSCITLHKPSLTNSELDQLLTEHGSSKLKAELDYSTRPVKAASSMTSLRLARHGHTRPSVGLRKGQSVRTGASYSSYPVVPELGRSMVRSVSLQRTYSPVITRHQ